MAHDQRYCVECGQRRGPLPAGIAGTIAAVFEQGRSVQRPDSQPAGAQPAGDAHDDVGAWPPWLGAWVPTTRSAAAAVMGMLGFGALVGSVVGSGVASPLGSPAAVYVSVTPPPAAATTSGGGNSAGGSSSSGGTSNSSSAAPSSPATSPQTPASGSTTTTTTPTTTPTTAGLPPVKHVFMIVLSDEGYRQTFGSTDQYFSQKLPKQGELLESYYAVTSGELANEVALISGQGPTPQTAGDCPTYADFAATGKGSFGQVLGSGCAYPPQTQTLAGQLTAHKRGGWKAYVQDPDPVPAGQPATCRHPVLGAADSNAVPPATDPYVTWKNPFVYFHSLIDGKVCSHDDVSMNALAADLQKVSTTPALSYIVPSPCDDGSPQPCTTGAASGLAPAAVFLKLVIGEIERSPAYKADGMIAVTFDQAQQTGPDADTSSCCDAQAFPNLAAATTPGTTSTTPTTTTAPTTTTPPPVTVLGLTIPNVLALRPTTSTTPTTPVTTTTPTTPVTTTAPTTTTTTPSATPTPPGGGQVGLVLISKYVKAGSVDTFDQFNHFSLLATIEKLFKAPRLGYASDPSLLPFGSGVFNAGS